MSIVPVAFQEDTEVRAIAHQARDLVQLATDCQVVDVQSSEQAARSVAFETGPRTVVRITLAKDARE